MKERPILFQGAMVRALLDGSKTQTRRIMKPQMVYGDVCGLFPSWYLPNKARTGGTLYPNAKDQILATCPYGQPGDRLWVRETFMDLFSTGTEHYDSSGKRQRYAYAADCPPGSYSDEARKDYGLKWKPSIFMPRAACRILLEIVSVRVERLNDISEEDARAEGITDGGCINCGDPEPCKCTMPMPDARDAYCHLWGQINGPESWSANPWVWVVEFKRVPSEAT